MTWLYTLVFAGLLFSGSSDSDTRIANEPAVQPLFLSTSQNDVTEKIEQTYPLNPNGRVSICNVNGPIHIEAWDRSEVHLEATKIADSRESLSQMEVIVDARPDQIRIETEYKPWNYNDKTDRNRYRKLEVHYRLQVPRTAMLSEVEAVNGSVTVSNFTNLTKVSAVNGSVNATNLRGTAKLSTVNGTVNAYFDRVDSGSSISLDTVNGKVNLEVPSDINATLRAETMNGSISNEFGLPVKKGKYVGRNLYGRIGNGEVQIKLNSVNGGLAIGRKKDGRNPSSVINLLKTNDSDSDSEDSEDVSMTDSERTDKDIDKVVKKSSKHVKDAQKEIERIKPELEKIEASVLKDINVAVSDEVVRNAIVSGVKQQAAAMARVSDALWNTSPTSVTRRTNSFEVKGTPKVSIDARSCKVRLRGWDKSVVKYVLTEAREYQKAPVSVAETASESSISLVIKELHKGPVGYYDNDGNVRLDVFVPRKSNVSITSTEEIRVEGVSGRLEVRGEDSPVSIRDSEGSLKLTSSDGLVRVVGFKGELDLETADADVYLEGDFQKLTSSAVDASITLTVAADSNVSISTNAAIESEGLNIVRENGRTWRLGNGGPKYNFQFADGRLVVRNRSIVETN